jgi:pimeloyl-ACP methyl ester carboxylesterase
MPRLASISLWLLGAILALYIGVSALAWMYQGRMIYPAPLARAGVPPGFERITYRTADGLELSAGYRAARGDLPTLLFFHGNGADWQSTAGVTQRLAAHGFGVLAAEYRGYGGNPGVPSENGLYADGRAAFLYLREHGVAPNRTVLVGNSLGSGVATQLAGEVDALALVLISPFDSLEATASRHMRWLPVRTLLRDRYDNAGKLGRITIPVLILHGEADTLISLDQARRLAAARPDTELITYPEWGHDLVLHEEVQMRIAEAIHGIAARSTDPSPHAGGHACGRQMHPGQCQPQHDRQQPQA